MGAIFLDGTGSKSMIAEETPDALEPISRPTTDSFPYDSLPLESGRQCPFTRQTHGSESEQACEHPPLVYLPGCQSRKPQNRRGPQG